MLHYFNQLSKLVPNVSRETFDDLVQFSHLLVKWNESINLIRYHSIDELWERHILNCTSLVSLIPKDSRTLIDLGSGAGFPGIILQILTGFDTHLIESDTRKCIFLTEVGRQLQLSITVHNARIEQLTPWESDVITARALAPLPKLLELGKPFIEKTKICLFQKGENSIKEIYQTGRQLDVTDNNIVTIQGGRFNEQRDCNH